MTLFTPDLTEKDLETIATNIQDGLEELSLKLHPQEFRNHLGMSETGKPCSRQIFYKFRWMFQQNFDGRMRRLFARGHREEERFVSYLEGIGCKVERFDENGKQFRVSSVMGHYGGSCDAKVITPWFPNQLLGEFKTHNTRSFSKYYQEGLQKSKPEHFDQMCQYGWKMNIKYGLYFPENKNDDDIQVEILELDWKRAEQLEKKAADIILANEPPPRISDNPAFFECKHCDAKKICHDREIPLKNCRSCKMCMPTNDATWTCDRFGVIPEDFIKKGCDQWMPI